MSRRTAAEIRTADERGFERRDAGPNADFAFRGRTKIELRTAGEGAKMPGLGGYTAMFNSLSEPLGFFEDFREKIAAGAFDKTIGESDIRALFDHDPARVLGRSKGADGGTLTLSTDSEGLEFEVAELPDTSTGRDIAEMVERGDVDGCSFGFRTVQDAWDYDSDEADDVEVVRTLIEVRLFDVGPVTYPAYPETSAEVRSKAEGMRSAVPSLDLDSLRERRLRMVELDRTAPPT